MLSMASANCEYIFVREKGNRRSNRFILSIHLQRSKSFNFRICFSSFQLVYIFHVFIASLCFRIAILYIYTSQSLFFRAETNMIFLLWSMKYINEGQIRYHWLHFCFLQTFLSYNSKFLSQTDEERTNKNLDSIKSNRIEFFFQNL